MLLNCMANIAECRDEKKKKREALAQQCNIIRAVKKNNLSNIIIIIEIIRQAVGSNR